MRRALFTVTILMLGMSLAACGQVTARNGTARATAPATPTPDDPRDYTWLVLQLRTDGATVVTSDQIDQPDVPPGVNSTLAFPNQTSRILYVNGETVRVYTYSSTMAANADAARVSPDGSTVCISIGAEGQCTINDFIAPPYYFKTGRLIVSYVGTRLDVAHLLKRVLGSPFAGAPLS